jgi:hypothetical protein
MRPDTRFVALFGEVDDVEIEVFVPIPSTPQRNISVGRRLLYWRPIECASEQPPRAARRAERRTSVSEQ